MTNRKLSTACSVEDAIRTLRIPDDAAPYVVQCGNIDPEFPRRFVFGQVHVAPLQLAHFLIERGLGHLLEDGPCAYLLAADADDLVSDGADDDNDEDDEDDDDESADDDSTKSEDDDERPPRRTSRRRR